MLEFATDNKTAKNLSRRYRDKKLRRIYQGIYTDDLTTSIEHIVLQEWMKIIPYIVSQGILGYSSALVLKPVRFDSKSSIVFVVSTYEKTINLPGLVIKVYQGEPDKFFEQITPNLARSNLPRSLLENLTTVRGASYIGTKTVGIEGIEKILSKELHLRGEEKLNAIRDEARIIAKELNFNNEYEKLTKIISALLSTHHDKNVLVSPYTKAIAQNKPYDDYRVQLFDELIIYLKKCEFIFRQYQYEKNSFKNLSFYESYFSNFIEGTEFLIDEAEDIVFRGEEINNRHADSHDVLSNFIITNDLYEMSITPKTPEELIEILQRRHSILMKERPEKRPGEFKIEQNKAGNTYFVSPKESLGTLYQGFERYNILNPGFERALFMHFLISEIHPFDDGNGRLSRIMMNAELVSHEDYKIIIPTVHRDNYLNGLRLASRNKNFKSYVKVMDQAQAYTASINWKDYGEARDKIESDHANSTADEGIPLFNRILRTLKLSDIAS
ncbi:TPA: Fic family protein [Legionella pneumophila]|uniref:Fic family protein n=1 Tax=Legionella pneumophila TaxID=446 RepID=UPI001C198804|nr:Fic family protein [Legionella pneumophila]